MRRPHSLSLLLIVFALAAALGAEFDSVNGGDFYYRQFEGVPCDGRRGATMTAAVVTKFHSDPEVAFKIVDTVPVPVAGPGQVLVQVFAAGVNPVETYIRSGNYDGLPQLPWIPGNDGAGIIRALGQGVAELMPMLMVGDRVWVSKSVTGTYAQFTVADAFDVKRLPQQMSFEQGAAVSVAFRTAYKALVVRGRIEAGQTVLVHGGSGGVGLAAVQLAKVLGASRIAATAGTQRGRRLLREHGADVVFDHRDSPAYLASLRKYSSTNGGFDLIVEMLANVNLGHDLELLSQNGVVLVVGSRGEVLINPRDLMRRNAQIKGVLGGTPEEEHRTLQGVAAIVATGAVAPVVGVSLPLERAAESHVEVLDHDMTGGGALGKVVLLPFPWSADTQALRERNDIERRMGGPRNVNRTASQALKAERAAANGDEDGATGPHSGDSTNIMREL